MKTRTDFVSNSSSSSFIVKDDPGINEIYKEDAVSWEEFCNQWLHDYLFESFESACDSYYCGQSVWWSSSESKRYDVKQHVVYVDDEEYVKMFKTNRRPSLCLPESFRKLGNEICDAIMTARSISMLGDLTFWTAGEKDNDLLHEYSRNKWDAREKIIDGTVKSKLAEVKAWLISKIEDECKSWKFWYADLSDSDDSEQKGRENLSDVSWYVVFSNH